MLRRIQTWLKQFQADVERDVDYWLAVAEAKNVDLTNERVILLAEKKELEAKVKSLEDQLHHQQESANVTADLVLNKDKKIDDLAHDLLVVKSAKNKENKIAADFYKGVLGCLEVFKEEARNAHSDQERG
jgi:hypothetical protein